MKVNPLPADAKAATLKSSPQKIVLVVDDHEDTRVLLRFVFESHGYQVLEAVDGEEAVLTADNKRPDIILMDSNLIGVDGIEATRRIRKIPAVCDVPIIFLSGDAQPQARALAIASGANDYLVKPFNFDRLAMSVDQQLARRTEQGA